MASTRMGSYMGIWMCSLGMELRTYGFASRMSWFSFPLVWEWCAADFRLQQGLITALVSVGLQLMPGVVPYRLASQFHYAASLTLSVNLMRTNSCTLLRVVLTVMLITP